MPNKKVIFLAILALGARLFSLNESLWLDEATSVKVANLSLVDILTKFSPGDFHPPLYYFLLKAWVIFFGDTEVAVRMLSVIFGVASVILIYKVGLKLFSATKIAFYSGLFLALSPLHIYYSGEARMYSMTVFLSLGVVLFFIKTFLDKPNRRNFILFNVFSILLLYTNYLSCLLFIFLSIYIYLEKSKDKSIIKLWRTSIFILVLSFLPWVPVFYHQIQTAILANQNVPLWIQSLNSTSVKEIFLIPVKFMIGRISFDNKLIYAVYVALSTIIYVPLLISTTKNFKNAKFVWLWLTIPLLLAFLIGSGFSYFRLIFLLPAFCILVACGVRKYTFWGVVILSILSNTIYIANPKLHREDWRSAVNFIERNSNNQKAITLFVTDNQQDPYKYYATKTPSFGPSGLGGDFDTIWLMRYVQPIFDPEDSLKKGVEALGYKKVQEKDFNKVVVWQYVKDKAEYANRN